MEVTEYLTVDDLAERYKTSPETVRYWVFVDKAPRSVKFGRRRLFAREDVEAWEREAREGASVA
jgi:excisionase family DNA binding protein